ncbi:MAG: hypothetical protein WCY29_04125 [Novosphingobium sp.]
MVMVLDWKTNLAKSNERLFSFAAIFLRTALPKRQLVRVTCHEDAINLPYGSII